ncbi:MAG: hypothetical protein MJZ43_00915 [Bacteroidaceae bacterium]|nr:hypothetical protein [Bacteroidaceae bacterium]
MKKFLTFLALACLMVTGAWAAEPTTEQLFTLTTPGRGGWCCVDGQMKGTNQGGVSVTDNKQKYFAFVEYEGNTYLWNEAEQKFASSSGAMGSILIATPINWTAQDSGTYFFNFGAGKYVNLGGSNQLTIDGWSTADAGNKMTLTPVEGYDAAAVQAAIDAMTQKAITTITWNVKDGNNNVVASQTLENCVEGTSYTTSLNAYGTTISGNKTVTATKENQTIDLTYTVDSSLIPFQFSDGYAANANWYKLTIRSKYVYYDAANNKCNVTNDAPASVSKKDLFAFLGNPFNVVIINAALGEGKAFTAPLQDNGLLTGTEISNASGFSFENNDNHYVFRGNGSTDCYVNQLGSGLGYWKNGAGARDNGSTFTFTAAGDVSELFVLDADLVAAKAEALATLNEINIPALFPAADVTKAIQDINGIVYDKTNATSVSEATTTLNGIMTNFWALPNGKKFTYASWMNGGTEQAPRYLEAATAAGALTTSTAITPNNIFELENVGGANYKVKAVYQNAYLNSTNTAAEGSIYNLIYQGSENYVSLQFNGTTNAIHHQASGNKPVSWGTSSDASKWHVTAVSEEEYNDMTCGSALKTALDEAADAYAVNDAPLTATDIDADLITVGSQFSSPFTTTDGQKIGEVAATTEQVYSFLLDEDISTYWHSSWEGGAVAFHKHYLQVELTEAIDGTLQLTMGRRNANNDHPVKMSVEYSTTADGPYTLLPGYMYFNEISGYVTGTFHLPTQAKYLRFFSEQSNGTSNQRGYWHCAEFQLNKVTASKNTQNTEAAAALQTAIATAQSATPSQAAIDALLAAVETYKATMNPDVTYTYTLTDENGDTYTGSFTSNQPNPEPTITGVQGYSLENKVWGEGTFTADITFPFPVNTATRIASFNDNNFLWQADGTDVKVVKGATANSNVFDWIIIPSFSNGAFTFTIQNVAANKYLYAAGTSTAHAQGDVTLQDEGTALTFASSAFKMAEKNMYLSLNSSTGDNGRVQYLGTLDRTHGGTTVRFDAPSVIPTGLEITIGATGYATFYDEVARAIPEGVKAYYCNYNEGTGNLDTKDITVETDLTYIPAGVGVVLEGKAGTYTFNEVEASEDDWDFIEYIYYGEDGLTFSALGGTVEEITLAQAKEDYSADNIYVLSKVSDVIGFYKYEGETLGAHKAFYAPYDATEINGFALDFGGQTVGVSTVISATNLKAGFDIQGRRINKMQKGINILNGKKIIK